MASEFKSTHEQIKELLNSNFNAKTIFNFITNAKTDDIGETLIDLIAENANDFTKSIALKFKDEIELTLKQIVEGKKKEKKFSPKITWPNKTRDLIDMVRQSPA